MTVEYATAVAEVIAILDDSRSLVTKSFGVTDAEYNEAIEKIKTIDI
jgi:hypothetical protein